MGVWSSGTRSLLAHQCLRKSQIHQRNERMPCSSLLRGSRLLFSMRTLNDLGSRGTDARLLSPAYFIMLDPISLPKWHELKSPMDPRRIWWSTRHAPPRLDIDKLWPVARRGLDEARSPLFQQSQTNPTTGGLVWSGLVTKAVVVRAKLTLPKQGTRAEVRTATLKRSRMHSRLPSLPSSVNGPQPRRDRPGDASNSHLKSESSNMSSRDRDVDLCGFS
ncbi:hypothetical protein BJ170DRAFT_50067 [Xylariales sp. AK1849]|nr:hypothetical protein BJ170DRAFT_50067 [Xylariales sp. AK1849]